MDLFLSQYFENSFRLKVLEEWFSFLRLKLGGAMSVSVLVIQLSNGHICVPILQLVWVGTVSVAVR